MIADIQISSVVSNKVFVAYADKEVTTPFLLIEDVSKDPVDCKDRSSVMDDYVFIVSAVAENYGGTKELLERVRILLDMYSDNEFKGIRYNGLVPHYDGTQDYFIDTYSFKSLMTRP